MCMSLSKSRVCASARVKHIPTIGERVEFLATHIENGDIIMNAADITEFAIKKLELDPSDRDSILYHSLKIGFNTFEELVDLVTQLRDQRRFYIRSIPAYFKYMMKRTEVYMGLGKIRYLDLPRHIDTHFFNSSIFIEIEKAVEEAIIKTGGLIEYRETLVSYCLRLGISAFQDRVDEVLSCHRQGEINSPGAVLYLRILRDSHKENNHENHLH